VRGELPAFSPHLAVEFSVTAPDYLPWGGTHLGKAFFDDVLHHLPETLDFSRVRYDSFTAEGTHAVALITIGIADAPRTVKISQRWEVIAAVARRHPPVVSLRRSHGAAVSGSRDLRSAKWPVLSTAWRPTATSRSARRVLGRRG
jgi:hypothetical protein